MRLIFTSLLLSISGVVFGFQTITITTQPEPDVYYQASVSADSIRLDTGSSTIALAPYAYTVESDPSLRAYALPDGSVIIRENIANFVFYDTFGTIKASLSNSTGSAGGEAVSELVLDAEGKTAVVYNPKVKRDGRDGSRARALKVTDPQQVASIYYSSDRTISMVDISEDGEMIAVVSERPGTDNQIHITDSYGFSYQQISFDQQVKGVSFDSGKRFVTVYSGGRVAVYDLITGERKGSTSVRNATVQYANYSPQDNTILALSASGSDSLQEVELHAVNIRARKIVRESLGRSLTRRHPTQFMRLKAGTYEIRGFSDRVKITTKF